MWGATDVNHDFVKSFTISIHAPRVGSDRPTSPELRCRDISIHAPRVGSDQTIWAILFKLPDFNPRSPCGERRRSRRRHTGTIDFNPRSPCGERHATAYQEALSNTFQSTLPVWGATAASMTAFRISEISIHAPRVGSDLPSAAKQADWGHFNPRSPCGERQKLRYLKLLPERFQSTLPVWGATLVLSLCMEIFLFQSTLPVWGATGRMRKAVQKRTISIHAPRVGSDIIGGDPGSDYNISIHAPRVGSDLAAPFTADCRTISIHAPRVGSDDWRHGLWHDPLYFNPRSPCGERRNPFKLLKELWGFQSTLPVWGATPVSSGPTDGPGISIHAPRVGSDLKV